MRKPEQEESTEIAAGLHEHTLAQEADESWYSDDDEHYMMLSIKEYEDDRRLEDDSWYDDNDPDDFWYVNDWISVEGEEG